MAEFIVMPKLGFDMREGVLNQWLKNIGDPISRGEVVAEIESDKATLDLESQTEGILLKILENAGAVVPIGANMAIVGQEGEDIAGMVLKSTSSAEDSPPVAEAVAVVGAASVPAAAAVSGEYPGGVKATPVARRIAAERGVPLAAVPGSGSEGRVRKADVEAYLLNSPAPSQARAVPAGMAVPSGDEVEEVPLTKLRQAIGRRMTESKTTVPHFYVTSEVDMQAALDLRQQINAALPDEKKVTVNDMIVKAAGLSLREFPNLNSAFAGDKIARYGYVNVGTAVAVEGGLLTVVQKNTDVSPLSTIAADNKEMITRARDGRIKPEDVQGATFTISNLGAFDVDSFVAIINPPDAAILAVGSARQVPVVVDGELTVGNRMKITISADHRVTDGVEAAQFLQAVKAKLENPVSLLL